MWTAPKMSIQVLAVSSAVLNPIWVSFGATAQNTTVKGHPCKKLDLSEIVKMLIRALYRIL